MQDLEQLYEERVRGLPDPDCEVLYGRAGYLAALLFAAEHTAQAVNKGIVQVWMAGGGGGSIDARG